MPLRIGSYVMIGVMVAGGFLGCKHREKVLREQPVAILPTTLEHLFPAIECAIDGYNAFRENSDFGRNALESKLRQYRRYLEEWQPRSPSDSKAYIKTDYYLTKISAVLDEAPDILSGHEINRFPSSFEIGEPAKRF